MSPHTIFVLVIAIIVADFILECGLKFLNFKNLSGRIPTELSDMYDADMYLKSMSYEKANLRFVLVSSTWNLLLLLAMFFLEGFAFTDALAAGISSHPILQPLIFFGILILLVDILNIPFAIYDTFVIEARFGFNKTVPKLFIIDKFKSWLLLAVIGGGIMAAVIWFYIQTPTYFWVWTWLIVAAFMLFTTLFYSSLIVPLFNKQLPLKDGKLKDEITKRAKEADFRLDKIYTIDGSKRSTKANAYFSGMGRKKRIVLFDTLITELSTNEIVAVLMHEIGHYRSKHIVSSMILSIIQTGLMLFILSLFVSQPVLSQALGVEHASFHIGLIVFMALYSPLSVSIGLFMNVLSRKHEFQADNFAARYGMGEDLIGALRKLSVNNLTNLTPHSLYVFFYYSHPTLLQRIRNLRKSN